MMLRIDERLPDSQLESEVVLHVRLHARRAVRRKDLGAPEALALLFGFGKDDNEWAEAANAPDPLQAGAAHAQRLRGSTEAVVALGHDASHIEHCKRWLAARKKQDGVFDEIEASDLATLLELSKARDLAAAKAVDGRAGERYLPILIQGPTGTGKELLADALHRLWKAITNKPHGPFEVVHVGGMSADMINDELFGHAKGGFTGATADRVGRLEAADGGTLLIDEVGDLPPEAQVRLLRFLQTQEVSRIGENKVRQLSVRVVAATWHDLDKNVADGEVPRGSAASTARGGRASLAGARRPGGILRRPTACATQSAETLCEAPHHSERAGRPRAAFLARELARARGGSRRDRRTRGGGDAPTRTPAPCTYSAATLRCRWPNEPSGSSSTRSTAAVYLMSTCRGASTRSPSRSRTRRRNQRTSSLRASRTFSRCSTTTRTNTSATSQR
jgi:hypothetical protein